MTCKLRLALLALLLASVSLAQPSVRAEEKEEESYPEELQPTESDVRYGEHRRHKLHFWKVESTNPTAVAIHFHGGGWNGGKRMNKNLRPVLPELLKANISVASVEYRLIKQAVSEGIDPPVKAPLHDCARAVQFIRSKSAQWNLDPNRVAVFGGSAGGCTSLWLAFHDDLADPDSEDPVSRESTRPNVIAAYRAQTTLDPVQMKQWIPNGFYGGHAFGITGPHGKEHRAANVAKFLAQRDELLPVINRYSPFALASSDDPPVYLCYPTKPVTEGTTTDPTHCANYGVKLQERLNQLQVKSELAYPGAPDVIHEDIADYLVSRLK